MEGRKKEKDADRDYEREDMECQKSQAVPGKRGGAHLTSSWGALLETSRTKSFAFSSPPRGEWNAMWSSSSSTERCRKDLQLLWERDGATVSIT